MILQEIKKIFGIKRLLLIIFLAVLFYFLFFQSTVGIPAYSSERLLIEVSLELYEKYGESMDEAEYRDLLENSYHKEESAIDRWLKENEEYNQYGIENYEDWITMHSSLPEAAARSLSSMLLVNFSTEENQAAMDIVSRNMYINSAIEAYDAELKSNQASGQSEKEKERIAERNQEEIYSLLPYIVMRNYLNIFSNFTIFLFLSMIFLIVPYSVKDTMEGISVLQYTSLNGYRYYWKKLSAIFISCFILCLIETGWFALMIGINHFYTFTGCFVSGFWSSFVTFVKLTFGQYITISLAYIITIALCLAMITYALSSCTHNYISAMALQIPSIIFCFAICFGFMANFAEITQSILLLCLIPCICFLVAVIGNVIRFRSIKLYEQF